MAACGQQHPTFVINERPGDTTELRRLRDAAAEDEFTFLKPFYCILISFRLIYLAYFTIKKNYF
jgi:hypothetical protein